MMDKQQPEHEQLLTEIYNFSSQFRELANLPNLSDKERNYLYNYATNKCQTGDFKNAIPLFQLLVLLEPGNFIYIKSFAGALHGEGRFAEAVELYKVVYLLDVKLHCDTLYYMGDCLVNLKMYDEARTNLNLFLEVASSDLYKEKFASQIKRTHLLLAGILN